MCAPRVVIAAVAKIVLKVSSSENALKIGDLTLHELARDGHMIVPAEVAALLAAILDNGGVGQGQLIQWMLDLGLIANEPFDPDEHKGKGEALPGDTFARYSSCLEDFMARARQHLPPITEKMH